MQIHIENVNIVFKGESIMAQDFEQFKADVKTIQENLSGVPAQLDKIYTEIVAAVEALKTKADQGQTGPDLTAEFEAIHAAADTLRETKGKLDGLDALNPDEVTAPDTLSGSETVPGAEADTLPASEGDDTVSGAELPAGETPAAEPDVQETALDPQDPEANL